MNAVILGAKERQNVLKVNRNPYRREADLDREGRPTNTMGTGEVS